MNAKQAAVCDPEEKMPFLEARRKWKENNLDNKKIAREAFGKFN